MGFLQTAVEMGFAELGKLLSQACEKAVTR